MKIINTYPPNFTEIVKVLSSARKYGVIFAYGNKIYNPSRVKIDKHLLAHEEVHSERQINMGVEEWWVQYLQDDEFRYNEELLAHRVEYRSRMNSAANRQQRKSADKEIAKKLASPLYGGQRSWKQTKKDILND